VSKEFVKVPNEVIRNETVKISSGDFVLYLRLCYLYFKNYQKEEIEIDHKKLMINIGITDTRTLKKRLQSLHKNKLIKNEIKSLPRRGNMKIVFNSDFFQKGKYFTMMNTRIFNYIHKLNEHSIRILFYYKSHINLNDEDKSKKYCFVGLETIKNNLKMGWDTLLKANDELTDYNLIRVVKHKLKTDYSYNENDELIFTKYNNHYYVSESLF